MNRREFNLDQSRFEFKPVSTAIPTCVKCGRILLDAEDRQTARCGSYPARYLCQEHLELVNQFLNARIELESSLPFDPTPRRGA